MTNKKLLIGSLSNDLMRIANLSYSGSDKAAKNFVIQAKRWIKELKNEEVKDYIIRIIRKLDEDFSRVNLTKDKAEDYLMYSILLQNYSLGME